MVQNGFTFWGVLEAIKEWLKLYVVQMHNAYDVFFSIFLSFWDISSSECEPCCTLNYTCKLL